MSSLNDFKNKIIEKAWQDADFKKELLEDPKAAIQKASGTLIPANIEITVLEETEDKLYLVIPANPTDTEVDEAIPECVW